MRVALVHEFLTQLGGAERVLAAFHEIFPDAPVFTLVYDEEKTQGVFRGWDIRPSFLQKLPGGVGHYKWYLPFMPRAVEGFDLSEFDVVLSDSSAFAKGVNTSGKKHICYCHTPTRYLWESMDEYTGSAVPWLLRLPARFYLNKYLKPWDREAAKRLDVMIANSRTVQERIKKYYGRDSQVIYPPVDAQFFTPLPSPPHKGEGKYYFTASRLEPYKKIDLVIEAFNDLKLPLKVAGSGTDFEALKKLAGPNIQFLGRVSDMAIRELYRGARAFVFPALEDAGIMVLEAMACGTPVIGYGKGGTAEFVHDGENGILFENQSAADIASSVKRFSDTSFDGEKIRAGVLQFGKEQFKEKIKKCVSA